VDRVPEAVQGGLGDLGLLEKSQISIPDYTSLILFCIKKGWAHVEGIDG